MKSLPIADKQSLSDLRNRQSLNFGKVPDIKPGIFSAKKCQYVRITDTFYFGTKNAYMSIVRRIRTTGKYPAKD